MSAAAALKDARADTKTAAAAGARRHPVNSSGKTHDSYLQRYQELKHMRENMNQPRNQQNLRNNETNNAQDEAKAEIPQMNEKLEDQKTPSGPKKTKLCVLF